MDKYVFFHIYADGGWQEPVKEFIHGYRKWGLIDNVLILRLGMVGNSKNQSQVMQYFINERINFAVVAKENTGWEQVTQKKLFDFAQHRDGAVLYIHTKGASRKLPDGTHELWRRSMYYYNLSQWKLAEQKLTEGYDAVGQHWMYPTKAHPEHRGSPFFGGTVWWTTLAHIRKIGSPPTNIRHDAEGWIGYQYGFDMKTYDYTAKICSHPGHAAWTPETQNWINE